MCRMSRLTPSSAVDFGRTNSADGGRREAGGRGVCAARAKIDRKAKRQKRRTVLHMLDRVVRVAAVPDCGGRIAFPIALANSEAFREQILQLVLSINPETGMAHVGMEPAKEEQTANVPRMDVRTAGRGCSSRRSCRTACRWCAAKRRAATRCTAKPTMPTRHAPCALRSGQPRRLERPRGGCAGADDLSAQRAGLPD